MIAKVIAAGRDRAEALARLRRAVRETTVIIEGGATNKSFLTALLEAPEVIDATADTAWVDRARGAGRLATGQRAGLALAAAAIDGTSRPRATERARLRESGRGGRPHVRHQPGQVIELVSRRPAYRVSVGRTGADRYQVLIGHDAGETASFEVGQERMDAHLSRLTVGGRAYRLATAIHGPVHVVEVDGITHRVSRDEAASCALRPPRSWSRRRSGGARWPARAARCWCWSR